MRMLHLPQMRILLLATPVVYLLLLVYVTLSLSQTDKNSFSPQQPFESAAENNISIKLNNEKLSSPSRCKTLWFAGFYDGADTIDEYARFYSAALLSAKELAPGLLQPILLVGHLEEDRASIAPKVQRVKDQFYHWVQEQGGTVIHRDQLSFQNIINQYYSEVSPSHRQGPFFRLDIPHIIYQHKLLKREGVCQHDDVVLYTDCDVLFTDVTTSSLEEAKALVRGRVSVAYGPQQWKINKAKNTGVMFISTHKFGSEVDNILKFGRDQLFKFQSFDQGLINAYFDKNLSSRAILPLEWNYKVYWGQPTPSGTSNSRLAAHIVHFHGPKPDGVNLDCLASMNPHSSICKSITPAYKLLIGNGFEADLGYFAKRISVQFYQYANSYDWDHINASTVF